EGKVRNCRNGKAVNLMKLAFLMTMMVFMSIRSYGQWYNFGDGHDGNKSVTGTEYTDNIEFSVMEYNYNTSGGGGPYLIEVKIAGSSAAAQFVYNDRVLIADMSVSSTF